MHKKMKEQLLNAVKLRNGKKKWKKLGKSA